LDSILFLWEKCNNVNLYALRGIPRQPEETDGQWVECSKFPDVCSENSLLMYDVGNLVISLEEFQKFWVKMSLE
jgi:hypothetical protein